MTDEQQTTAPAQEEKKEAPVAPVIDPAVIAKITRDAADAARAQAAEEGKRQTQQIIHALGGGTTNRGPNYNTEGFVDRFIEDPAQVLAATADAAKRAAKDEIRAEMRAEASERAAVEKAFKNALKGRPDLADEETVSNLDAFLAHTDPNDSIEDRMKEAVNKYDLMIEKAGGPKAEERIRKATSVKTSGGSAQGVAPEKSIDERRTESFTTSQQDRLAKFKASRGGRLHHA